ncbi:MAG: cupin domain-containing protein [bacterium]
MKPDAASGGGMFIDQSGAAVARLDLWPALVIPRAAIDAEIARLAALPAPANGRRRALIVHPNATAPGLGLAPGIQVALQVLLPRERTTPLRHNSTQVDFCIAGSGVALVAGRRIAFAQYDVWNTPSMAPYTVANDGDTVQVRLTYSNAALLEKMQVHVVEELSDTAMSAADARAEADHAASDAGAGWRPDTFQLTADGAYLKPYEQLINPDAVESTALHWPWRLVQAELDKLVALGRDYRGRRLYLLFNPATGRTNGTTHSFFATLTIRPPGIVDRPHRHTSAAVNYYFAGRGRSTVEGQRYEWGPGDLMFSAPGWGVHNHASYDDGPVYELTIQDSPLNIAMESLLWQEDLKGPVSVLGSQHGFATNRPKKSESTDEPR